MGTRRQHLGAAELMISTRGGNVTSVQRPEHRDVELPQGTVTFLLTDVEGSTRLWEQDRDAMRAAMGRHGEIVADVVAACGGVRPEEQGEGDSVVAVFTSAADAVTAAADIQRVLAQEPWPTA